MATNESLFEVSGPTLDHREIRAFADGHLQYPERTHATWQHDLRDELRRRLPTLKADAGEVLHAVFFGPAPRGSDVENLLLYNLDQLVAFRPAGGVGVRFEAAGAAVPPTSASGRRYRNVYVYRLAQLSGGFLHQRVGARVAAFGWTVVAGTPGHLDRLDVWRAIRSGVVETTASPVSPGTPYALRIEVRAPASSKLAPAETIKPLFDGIITALQAHGGGADLAETVERLARLVPLTTEQLAEMMVERRQAVLGVVPRLIYPYRDGVKLNPSDDLCVAGQVIFAESERTADWCIRGEIVVLDG